MHIKRSVFWVLLGAPMLTFAQQPYTLQVKIGKLMNPGTAYLNYQTGDKLMADSALLKDGVYHFKGSIKEPALARLAIRKAGAKVNEPMLFNAAVWLEKGNLQLSAIDATAEPVITGGTLNSDYQRLETSKAPERDKIMAASEKVANANEEERKSPEYLKAHMIVMKAAMNASAIKDSLYISSHPASYLSLYMIANSISTAPVPQLEKQLAALSKSLQNSALGKSLNSSIQVLKNREVGGQAPGFTLKDVHNQPVSLASFRGKYVLLDFWASWCIPCRKENPNVKAAYANFKNKKFTVVSVSIDAPAARAKWLAAVKEDQLDWTQLCDEPGGSNQAALLYNISAIPQNFLIDPNGKIIAKNLRGEELQKSLARLIH